MRISHLLFTFLVLLPSCAIYRKQFDCPPDQGVPCTSLTDLEQMIVETDHGPDLFLTGEPVACKTLCKKVWISADYLPDGRWVPGHYIYLD